MHIQPKVLPALVKQNIARYLPCSHLRFAQHRPSLLLLNLLPSCSPPPPPSNQLHPVPPKPKQLGLLARRFPHYIDINNLLPSDLSSLSGQNDRTKRAEKLTSMSCFASNHFPLTIQTETPSPITPGSDTSTLFEFVNDPSPSPRDTGKFAAVASPTETLAHWNSSSDYPYTLSPRRLAYLEHIEKVLSAELNPFDLLARRELNNELIRAVERKPCDTGSRGFDVHRNAPTAMQNSGSSAQNQLNAIAQANLSHESLQNIQNGAFYDPSSADGYSAPSQSSFLSAAPALSPSGSSASGSQLNAPNAFRDHNVHPSPSSSPFLGAVSPAASHHRAGSHSSDAASPPPLGQGFMSDPSLTQAVGQMGQIKLDEDQRYPPTFDESSDHAGSPAYQPQSQTIGGASSSAYPSISSQTYGNQAASNAPQLTLGIPTVSVSDTSMDYTPVAASVDAAMPSINVMAPSPSTPKAMGGHGQQGGFQDLLAQLAASSQGASSGAAAPSDQPGTSSSNWLASDPSATSMHQEPFSYADASGSTVESQLGSTLQQPSSGQNLFRPHSAAGRIVPEGYSAEPTQIMSSLAGNQSRNPAVHAPGQWSSQAKRQDSYDKIRQFLRLDVDMGFQSNGKTESPTLASFRKRANSDVGPRSPVVAGNAGGAGTAFDWSFAATNQANTDAKTQDSGLDLDWSSLKTDPSTFGGPTMQMDPSQLATMDPSLLNNTQGNVNVSQAFGDSSTLFAQLQQQQQQHQLQLQQQQQTQQPQQQYQHQQQQPQIMPPVFQLNGQSNTMGGVDFSQLGASGSNEFNPQWRFPGDASQQATGTDATGAPKLRRSNSARQSASAGHRRLAHSEDLSRSRMYQGNDEDFLMQITAPNGGLAPPSTGRSVSSSNAATGSHHHTMSGSARVHPYRTGHDRHYSFGSNASSSSTGSASPLPQMAGGLMYDAAGNLVEYPTDAFGATGGMGMEGVAQSPSASSVASGTSSHSRLAAPPVPVVTSQATQAASASRRKSEALFACPIPGCGSTFTRQYNLRGHLRSHADERPYKCDWPGCDRSFARSHDCKRHQNLHLNIKPHTCEQCGKTFARLDALNRHHKSDTGGCTMKSDSESQSNSTDASSAASAGGDGSGSQAGSEFGGQKWAGGSTTADASQPNKTFGGHVL